METQHVEVSRMISLRRRSVLRDRFSSLSDWDWRLEGGVFGVLGAAVTGICVLDRCFKPRALRFGSLAISECGCLATTIAAGSNSSEGPGLRRAVAWSFEESISPTSCA